MITLRVPRREVSTQGGPADHKAAGRPLVLIRGGGDIATGVAARLDRSGFSVLVTEIARPLAIRRLVSLAEAVYAGEVKIEDLRGLLVNDAGAVPGALSAGVIPVMVDPTAEARKVLQPAALVDGRMLKTTPEMGMEAAALVIGLGPGFTAGENCHAAVETNRGHRMGRVIWDGSTQPDTAVPEAVSGFDVERVLRAPAAGRIRARCALGTVVQRGDKIVDIGEAVLRAPFDGVLRGLMHDDLEVETGAKIGDLDPRGDPATCFEISDKALAVGGGVLEALLSRPEIRRLLAG
jgi:xanthine dehydrogenase accessory factor